MSVSFKRRPRYADVAATAALLLAMGGTAYAATSLAPNSVGTAQLKNHAVTTSKLAGIDEVGTVTFGLAPRSCAPIHLRVRGATPGETAVLSLGKSKGLANVVEGPLQVKSSTKVIVQMCNISDSAIHAHGLSMRLIALK